MKIVINPVRPGLSEAAQDFHLLIRLQSEPQQGFRRTPLQLALVLDRSGSMQGNKLNEAKRCVADLVARMHPTDYVGLVQYDDVADTLLPLAPVDEIGSTLQTIVEGIRAGGSTNLHQGWLRAGEMLAPHAGGESACHVILLSDGLANVGLTDPPRICQHVAALAEAGVTTTTVGLGTTFNEALMTAIARAGRGSAHYGERAIDLAETFDAEIGLLSQLQWRNVQMKITSGPPQIQVLNAYPREGNVWRLPCIALGSECWALLRMPVGEALRAQQQQGTVLTLEVEATDPTGARLTFTASLPPLAELAPQDYNALQVHELVQRRIIELAAAELQLKIRDAALHGDWAEAEHLLTRLEAIGRHEPWVAESIAFTRQLLRERDEQRTSKELLYKSERMYTRLSSLEEPLYSRRQVAEEQAFLRRKMTEGRRTEE